MSQKASNGGNGEEEKLLSSEGIEDEKQIEQLALSTDFDPAFLDCWEDEAAAAESATASNSASAYGSSTPAVNDSNGGPSFSTSIQNPLHRNNNIESKNVHTTGTAPMMSSLGVPPGESADATWDEFDQAHQALFGTSGVGLSGDPNSGSNSATSVPANSDGTTTLPPFETTTTASQSAAAAVVMGLLQQQQQQQQPLMAAQGIPILPQPEPPQLFHQQPPGEMTQSDPQLHDPLLFSRSTVNNATTPSFMDSSALLPLAFNALQAGVDLSSFLNASGISAGDAVAAAPTAAATVSSNATSIASPVPPSSVATSVEQMQGVAPAGGVKPPPTFADEEASANAPAKKKATGRKKSAGGGRRKKGQTASKKKGASGDGKNSAEDEEEPPFMLFDAPVELRTNFNRSQMEQGLPQISDNNSYHYAKSSTTSSRDSALGAGNTLNTNQSFPLPSRAASATPKLADARHGDDIGTKRIKNAKEQKRAQRITELIEQLRFRMERGGWKVGIKSKLQTLSSCSGYLKHLVKVTKEKEEEVEKAKGELEVKRRKLELEKSAQDPSEPESTTSSLTVSSGSRSTHRYGTNNPQEQGKGNCDKTHNNSSHGQSLYPSFQGRTKDKSILDGKGAFAARNGPDLASEESEGSPDKKRKLSSHESNSEEYSSSVDNDESDGKKSRKVGQVSIGPISSVSDITDNNKYNSKSSSSSDDTSGTMTRAAQGDTKKSSTPQPDPSAQNTVCSDAAVAETSTPKDNSHDGSSGKPDEDNNQVGLSIQTITTTTRKRKLQELSRLRSDKPSRDATSLEANFRLDYEEVFLKSNVPQIIASTTGRIVAFNEIFLRATALRRNQVDRLTIFSLVQTSMLSNLFELVASSLREDDQQERRNNSTKTLQDYSTMTLPCVPFHADRPHLFMTITLMSDDDVKKRCFHCIFTDSEPTVKGSVGSVTPQLLATLFHPVVESSESGKKNQKRSPDEDESKITSALLGTTDAEEGSKQS